MLLVHRTSACAEWLTQLGGYIDGDQEAAICAEVEAHLAVCPDCRVLVDTVRKTISLYRSEAPGELPPDVEGRLFRVLRLDP